MTRQRSGGRSGARTSAFDATENSSAAPSPVRQGNRHTKPSKRGNSGSRGSPDAARGLVIIATPIGNLADVTIRALEILRAVDTIACEDTRITRRLLSRHDITTSTLAYHEHNADRVRPRLIERLSKGESVALVSDAGTPLISDPGFKLVRAAIDAAIPVSALPGPTAMVTALTVSGLPTDRFLFAGFLPNKQGARRRALEDLRGLDATLVFYESPRRLAAALADMADLLSPRNAAVARELTKIHEEVTRAPLDALAKRFAEAGPPRGEIVIVVGPPETTHPDESSLDERLRVALSRHSLRDAVDRVTAETRLPRRRVYRRALALSVEPEPEDGKGAS